VRSRGNLFKIRKEGKMMRNRIFVFSFVVLALLVSTPLFAEAIDYGVVFSENPKLFFCVEEHSLHIAQLSYVGAVMRGKIPGLKVKMNEKGSHEHPFLL